MKSGTSIGLTAALLLSSAAARADVEISKKPTSNMSCVSGVCTATAQKAVLNVSDLATMLANGDVAVKTGLVTKDIGIDQPLSWTTTSRLTLDAQQSVMVNKQVTVAGQGALTVATNDNGQPKAKTKTGEFIIVPEHGSVQFWDLSSSLAIDGNAYTLVGDIKTLASDIAANPSGFYALAKPYDASVDGTYSESPIQTTFSGDLDGLGNSISNLTIKFQPAQNGVAVGLLSQIGSSGKIRDLAIDKANLQGIGGGTYGGIAPLAGANFGTVVRCSATSSITLPGGDNQIPGGLIGGNAGSISRSFARTRIEVRGGTSSAIAALVGLNVGAIDMSYADGKLSMGHGADSEVGGLAGYNSGQVSNSFALAAVHDKPGNSGSMDFGGLVGLNDASGRIGTSYASGNITEAPHSRESILGGLIGFDGSAVSTSYWNLDKGISDPSRGAGNIKNDPGITGLTTAQLQSGLPQGFDSKIWGQNSKINSGLPYLLAVPPK